MSDQAATRWNRDTLVLILTHPLQLSPLKYLTSAHPAGYDYDAAYDDEYPPQQPYPHPGIRGLQVTSLHHLDHTICCSTEGTEGSTRLVGCQTRPNGATRRRATVEDTARTRRESSTTGLGKSHSSAGDRS